MALGRRDLLGGVLVVLASLGFSIGSFIAGSSDGHPLAIVFFNRVVAFVILLPYMLSKGAGHLARAPLKGLSLSRGILGMVGILVTVITMHFLPVLDVVLLERLSVFMVPLFALLFLKSRISRGMVFAVGMGFLGVWFVVNPHDELLRLGALFGVLAALFNGLNLTISKQLSKVQSGQQYLFYLFGVGGLVSLPGLFMGVPKTALFWLILMGIAKGAGQLMLVSGLRRTSVTRASVLLNMDLFFVTLFSLLFAHVRPTQEVLVGLILISAASVATVILPRRERALAVE